MPLVPSKTKHTWTISEICVLWLEGRKTDRDTDRRSQYGQTDRQTDKLTDRGRRKEHYAISVDGCVIYSKLWIII